MSLRRFGFNHIDHTFWQILIPCSGLELIEHGKEFIASCEFNSPGLRLVFLPYDHQREAYAFLEKLSETCFSTIIYLLDINDKIKDAPHQTIAFHGTEWLLEHSHASVLLMDLKSKIIQDLAILPLELRPAQLSFPKECPKHKSSYRTVPIWFGVGSFTENLLKSLIDRLSAHEAADPKQVYDLIAEVSLSLQLSSKVADLPAKYWEEAVERPYITTQTQNRLREQSLLEAFDQKPEVIVLQPLQDIGAKVPLLKNNFKKRTERLSRPHRQNWRYAAALIASLKRGEGSNTRVIPVSQWEINAKLIKDLAFAKEIYVPHKTRRQLPDLKLRFYMQEFLPDLFTISETGWGASANWYNSAEFANYKVDPRLRPFKSHFISTRITKGPQEKEQVEPLPDFDVLAVLQVPGDEALILHANCTQEQFIQDLADLAERRKVRVLIRKHPLDRTNFFDIMRRSVASNYVIFSTKGHIHDVLKAASTVAVINSSVGFEAMFYGKPIISWGKAVYDEAVTLVDASNGIDCAYSRAQDESEDDRLNKYDRFLSWYLFEIGYKLDEPKFKLGSVFREAGPVENPVYRQFLDEQIHLKQSEINKSAKKLTAAKWQSITTASFLSRYKKSKHKLAKIMSKFIAHPIQSELKRRKLLILDDCFFTGKRVVLVGNASSLLQQELGNYIDEHDIVIRMNLGSPHIVRTSPSDAHFPHEHLYGKFIDLRSSGLETYYVLSPDAPAEIQKEHTAVRSTGHKTTIWSCSTADRSRQKFFADVFQDALPVACHPNVFHLSTKFIQQRNVRRLRIQPTMELKRKLKIEPTSGMIWIEYLSQIQLSELSLVGFDFSQSGHSVRTAPSLLDATGRTRHQPHIEKDYVLNTILAQDSRIKLF